MILSIDSFYKHHQFVIKRSIVSILCRSWFHESSWLNDTKSFKLHKHSFIGTMAGIRPFHKNKLDCGATK